ncbi:MAG TPA: hypothetical protein VFM05_09140 [Candidatus Saccharimonadales bacterium]|nr:hypothetical protein [Candidatus Saccharimonadales bacterium]
MRDRFDEDPERDDYGELPDDVAEWLELLGEALGPEETEDGPAADYPDDLTPPGPPGGSTELGGEAEEGPLRNLLTFAGEYAHRLHEAIVDAVELDEAASYQVIELTAGGMPYDDAVEEAARESTTEDGVSIWDSVSSTTLYHAIVACEDALATTGLELQADAISEQIHLTMVNPATFIAALRQISTPETAAARISLSTQIAPIIDSALDSTVTTALLRHPQVAETIFTDDQPDFIDLSSLSAAEAQQIVNERAALVDGLAARSTDLAAELDRLGIAGATAQALRQYAAAVAANMTAEWAIGHGTQLIGHSATRLGVDRYVFPTEWDDAYTYLRHLVATAPGSLFTRLAGNNILDDLRSALEEPDLTLIPLTGVREIDDAAHASRLALAAESEPLLREAQRRIRTILGYP